MTECPMICCGSTTDTDEQLANTDGAPVVGCEVRIEDDHGREVPAGVDGEIFVRGPMLAKGYVNPDQSAVAFRADGWFHTGDRGHMRTDDHIVITGTSTGIGAGKRTRFRP